MPTSPGVGAIARFEKRMRQWVESAHSFSEMLYCCNPSCPNPFNPDHQRFCQSCGAAILLPLFRNRYRVIRQLGEGGFGRTYEAKDVDRMDDPCVIKQFLPQVQGTAARQKATELFKQEANRLYELGEHPQIPRLNAYFEQDRRLYLVQEYIEGETLLQELRRGGPFGADKIYEILAELLPVLQIIHDRNIIHRDIKPDNIMRRRRDNQLMLIDFGVSKQVTGTTTAGPGTTVGTPGYVPMEQLRGQVYPASDLYSLGVTCLRLLTGCLPEESGRDALYDAMEGRWMWRSHLQPNVSMPPQLGVILDRLTQDLVRDRYQSAEEVLQTLKGANRSQPAPTPPPAPVRTVYKPPRATPKPPAIVPPVPTPVVPPKAPAQPRNPYSKLQDLLKAGKWREADAETSRLMLQIVGRSGDSWLTVSQVETFPCEELRQIDRLWDRASRGRFGFGVQKRIWQQVDRDVEGFGERVGWCDRGDADEIRWRDYDGLLFSVKAPQGHLPGLSVMVGREWDRSLWLLRHLFLSVEACGL